MLTARLSIGDKKSEEGEAMKEFRRASIAHSAKREKWRSYPRRYPRLATRWGLGKSRHAGLVHGAALPRSTFTSLKNPLLLTVARVLLGKPSSAIRTEPSALTRGLAPAPAAKEARTRAGR